MSIVIAIIVFLVVICLHELGHFVIAKKTNIKVNEFSVGMGPALHQRQKGETTYSLRLIPLGGYCAMEGEDEEEGSSDPRSYDNARPGQRFLTILAGPLMNLLIAYICFFIYLGLIGLPSLSIADFSEDSASRAAGLQAGDTLVAINGTMLENYDQLLQLIKDNGDQPLRLDYLRGDQTHQVEVKPTYQNGNYYLGIIVQRQTNWAASFGEAGKELFALYGLLFVVIGQLLTGQLSMDAVSGPIGVVSMIGQAAHQGLAQLMYLTGYISLNLAFFNLLPIPGLDGSKLLFILIEKIRGKKMSKKVESRITLAGFAFLMALIVFVTIKDVRRFF